MADEHKETTVSEVVEVIKGGAAHTAETGGLGGAVSTLVVALIDKFSPDTLAADPEHVAVAAFASAISWAVGHFHLRGKGAE